MSYNDEYLRPYLVSDCYYDVMFASKDLETPFRYDLNYRNYYVVTQGSVKVKLSPPKSSKYLYPVSDYENFEFKSAINPWNPQPKYRADFDKIKCLEIVLTPGKMLYIHTLSLPPIHTRNTHTFAYARASVHTCETAPPPVNGESSQQGESIMLRWASIIASKHRYQHHNHRIKPDAKFGPIDAMHLRDRCRRPTIQHNAWLGPLWASGAKCQTGTQKSSSRMGPTHVFPGFLGRGNGHQIRQSLFCAWES